MGSCLLLNLFYLNKSRFIMYSTHFKKILFVFWLLFVCFFGKLFLSSFSSVLREQWSNEEVIDFSRELLTAQARALCSLQFFISFFFLPHENVMCLFLTFLLHINFYKLISTYRICVCVLSWWFCEENSIGISTVDIFFFQLKLT